MNNINTGSNKDDNNKFWLSRPSVLFEEDNYKTIVPLPTMTTEEKFNTTTRFLIYLMIILLLLGQSIQIPIILILFLVIAFYTFSLESGKKKKEKFAETNYFPTRSFNDYRQSSCTIGRLDKSDKSDKSEKSIKTIHDNFTGKSYYAKDPHIPKEYNVEDSELSDSATGCYDDKLFKDVGEVFELENAHRQFFRPPEMKAEDQTNFAKWLYGGETCKTDQTKCLKYEELRYVRN